ncbi:aldehyde dehydrogenase family protein [Acidicapsa dinghuensis]|uniref:Aldehyde dehydrogenase family protein n=1 Tax=Acidicapsa dinghuensis TaxID=2218256 RepID=A0ABW1EE90_9BACT|nr:aldehyde dehydrogenase family protein [Acidicapsa dinghuensis]
MSVARILIHGKWVEAEASSFFRANNPATGEALAMQFPVSKWEDCERALAAAAFAVKELHDIAPAKIAAFLEEYAAAIEAAADEIVKAANEETGLPASPRLKDVELPRTTNQLRQAAAAAREESWKQATIDTARNIRSSFAAIGPVVVFGPNNFPLAFNGISGGDFAAAIVAGNPVIAKAHPLHPNTTRLLAEQAQMAADATGMPKGLVQLLYHVSNEDGLKLVSDARVGAIGFTGSRNAGIHLKRAAEEAGKPIYLEMSSINPVIFLPGTLEENAEVLAKELADSCLAASGQFCTSPNLILLWNGQTSEKFISTVAAIFNERAPQPLLSQNAPHQLSSGTKAFIDGGAQLVTGGKNASGPGYRFTNTLLRTSGKDMLAKPHELQREVFGNVTMITTVSDEKELAAILEKMEGNLTGTIYSAKSGKDDAVYARIESTLRQKVGRLLNDKMPTGVAVSPAMNHGGPFPATSHPGFTSVGIPASISRFAMLQCYDGVREGRLPEILRDKIKNSETWRSIDGAWVRG